MMAREQTDKLVDLLNTLLEAERAGAQVAGQTAKETDDENVASLMAVVRQDEARFCAMLARNIEKLGAIPSKNVGDFLERCMAIPDIGERIDFLNRGQGWVARRLREVIPTVSDQELLAELQNMLDVHVNNIESSDLVRRNL